MASETPRLIAGHLIVDADGNPWATYRVTPWSYGIGSVAERLDVLGDLESLIVAIPYRALMLGVCRHVSDVERLAAVAATTGARPARRWEAYQAEAADRIDPAFVREWWVSVALHRPQGLRVEALAAVKAVAGQVSARLMAEDVTATQLRGWTVEASRFVARLGRIGHRFEPADEKDVRWLYARAFRRGTRWEPAQSEMINAGDPARLIDVDPLPGFRRSAVSSLPEGGESHLAVVRIDDVPRTVTVPHGAEWMWQIDSLEIPADAVVWLETIPVDKAIKKVRRRHQNVADQHNQLASEAGPGLDLDDHDDDLANERRLLALRRQPLVKATYAVVVGAESADELEDIVSQVVGLYPGGLFRVYCPAGVQRQLIAAGLPGMRWTSAVTSKHVTQFGLPDAAAAAAPLCGSPLGDPHGLVLGYRSTGLAEPVLVDPAWGPTRAFPTSGSLGVVGLTGSGKGVMAKTLAHGALMAGHQMMFFDRSELRHNGLGEYEQFLRAVDCTRQVIPLHESGITLNPWTCLPVEEAVEVALDTAILLCNVSSPTHPRALVLAEACVYAGQQGGGWPLVLHFLAWRAREHRSADAREAETVLRTVAAASYGRAIFGEGEPLAVDADATVIWAPKLKLPEPGLDPDMAQIGGRAVMGLVVYLGRRLFMQNGGRYGALLLDEAWALLSTQAGAKWAESFAREGRKQALGVWLFTQNPDDIPSAVVEQLGYIGVTRVKPAQVGQAMALLGLAADSDAGRLMTHEDSGLVTWRDSQGRVGLVEVVAPRDEALWTAMDTTPILSKVPAA